MRHEHKRASRPRDPGWAYWSVRIRGCESHGRTDAPLLEGEALRPGLYELRFDAGSYHRKTKAVLTDPPFLGIVPVRFAIADASRHYHVPLLLSPYGYSTYRGS